MGDQQVTLADSYDLFSNFACVNSYFGFVWLRKTVSDNIVEDAMQDVTADTAQHTDEGVQDVGVN